MNAMLHSMVYAHVLLAATVAVAQPTTSDPPNEVAPTVHLSTERFPDGIDDEAAYEQWLADRTTEAIEAIDAADVPDRLELRLAAISAILAVQCEPPLSRSLLGMTDQADRDRVLDMTRRAKELLKSAREDLDRYEATPDPVDAAVEYFRSTIDMFDVFASVIDACVREDRSEGAKPRLRAAARDLAAYLEDDRAEVATAAMLWQGVLYGRAGRIDRALRTLPLPDEPFRRGAPRYDFFARLLRCRYLVRRGAYAAGWSLLLSLEERSREWFATERQRREAAHAVFLIKTEICDAWSADGDEADVTRAWCDETLERIRKDQFPPDQSQAVLRLKSAAPLIIAPEFQFTEEHPQQDVPEAEDSDDAKQESPQDAPQ